MPKTWIEVRGEEYEIEYEYEGDDPSVGIMRGTITEWSFVNNALPLDELTADEKEAIEEELLERAECRDDGLEFG